MHRFMLPVPLILLLILVQGCTSTRKVMDSWMGHHESELIQQWGAPSRTTSDGKCGKVHVYERFWNYHSPGYSYLDCRGHVRYVGLPCRSYSDSKMFYIDPDGIIYYWRTQGN